MKNVSPSKTAAWKNVTSAALPFTIVREPNRSRLKIVRTISVGLFVLGISFMPAVEPSAQKKERPVQVTGVSSSKSGNNAVVTVSADAPLTRTQTWQDEEGFHLTLPGAAPGSIKGLPRGVTVRNLGKSLEIVVAVKAGAGVTVDPRFNQLNLIVPGGMNTAQDEGKVEPVSRRPRAEEPSESTFDLSPSSGALRENRGAREGRSSKATLTGEADTARSQAVPSSKATDGAAPVSAVSTSPQFVPVANAVVAPVATAPPAQPVLDQSANAVLSDPDEGGVLSYIFSIQGMLIALLVVVIAVVWRRKRANGGFVEVGNESVIDQDASTALAVQESPPKERRTRPRRKSDMALVSANPAANSDMELADPATIGNQPVVPVQPAFYGAYRVDQEVGKLVLGQAHRMDVLASRSPDDRRAIETSLLKALNSPEYGEDGRRKSLEALEEYGFVARQCASLLLSRNAYDRASSARVLGEIGSQSSLPFLFEALYDAEGIVRAEAVTSLGALKMPSAIGALLDMARRHPEMPASLLSNALSACSVECFDFFDSAIPDRPFLEAGEMSYGGEITHLDPAGTVQDLPEWSEDEELTQALIDLKDSNVDTRAFAARRLSQFQVRLSVDALTAAAADDDEPTVRAAAVTSLGEIEHESVFAPVLMAFVDEAREVRAAAARSLSRSNFDRAEAYVRLIEEADPEVLSKVALACTKAGMVTLAIDRVISEDRRLAYEAYSLLSLLAKSGETGPLVDAISEHPEVDVRLALVRLIGSTGGPEAPALLRHLAVRDGLPEKVRSSVMEVVYKLDQEQPV